MSSRSRRHEYISRWKRWNIIKFFVNMAYLNVGVQCKRIETIVQLNTKLKVIRNNYCSFYAFWSQQKIISLKGIV